MEAMNEAPRELTDAELEVVTGGGVLTFLLAATYLAVWAGMVTADSFMAAK
jgi:hypothetical protein